MKSIGRRVGMLLGFVMMGTGAFCQVTSPGILGSWKSELKDKPVEMEIYQVADNMYAGKVINDSSKPSKNGTVVLSGLHFDQSAQAYKGTMRPADANVELDATLTATEKDRLKLVCKKLFITRTVYLSRLKQ